MDFGLSRCVLLSFLIICIHQFQGVHTELEVQDLPTELDVQSVQEDVVLVEQGVHSELEVHNVLTAGLGKAVKVDGEEKVCYDSDKKPTVEDAQDSVVITSNVKFTLPKPDNQNYEFGYIHFTPSQEEGNAKGTFKMDTPSQCEGEGKIITIESVHDKYERTLECKATNSDFELTLLNITHRDSGNHKIEVSLKIVDPLSQDSCLQVDPFFVPLVVAKEPELIRITGLDTPMKPTDLTREVKCVATIVRPALEREHFEWTIENWGNNDQAFEADEIPDKQNITNQDFGSVFTSTHKIMLKYNEALDGRRITCKVKNNGWAITADYNDTAEAFIEVQGPPVPVDDVIQVSSEEGQIYEVGEPATIYIPFHANPAPEWVMLSMVDIQPYIMVINSTQNSSSYGRYTAQRWVFENKTEVPTRSSVEDRSFFAVLRVSELEKDDMERSHEMLINNGIGNTTYRFQIPNIEGGGLSGGAIAGIVIGVLAGVTLIAVGGVMMVRSKNKKKSQKIKEDRRRRKREEGRADNPGYES